MVHSFCSRARLSTTIIRVQRLSAHENDYLQRLSCTGTQTHPHEPTSTHGPAPSPTHPHHGATPTNTCLDARTSTCYHSRTHKHSHLRLSYIIMRPRTHRSRQTRQQSRNAPLRHGVASPIKSCTSAPAVAVWCTCDMDFVMDHT